jgi:DNA ligase 1
MSFRLLVDVLVELEKTASRNLMTEIIAEYLNGLDEAEIAQAVYLLLGQLGPMYERIDFGLADKMVVRSVALTCGKSRDEIRMDYKNKGDLGIVAFDCFEGDNVPEVSVAAVYEWLLQVARASGKGSQEQKVALLADLLGRLGAMERKYLIRIVLGKMRLGFSNKTILDALAVMDGRPQVGKKYLENLYQLLPDIGEIARIVKRYGCVDADEHVSLTIGVPVMPALAQRLRSADDMIKKMGKVMAEPKFDGQRIQIHFSRTGEGALIKTYSRSLEENSLMFPELSSLSEQVAAKSVILDCEAVGYDPVSGVMKPFQETITRKRKHNVGDVSKSVPIVFNCFDLLYLDGESLLDKPLWERRSLLDGVVKGGGSLVLDSYLVTHSSEELRAYHKQQLALGLEGAMVKQYDGVYQPGRTGWNWVKFKEVEEARGKLSDTIDGVVMGYYRGRGKRSVFGIGAFLLGIMDNKTGDYVTVAKIGTGLSDEQWREMRRQVDENLSLVKPARYTVAKTLAPDVWADPKIVVEIAADEITKSPLHSSGFGLRFPRLVRFREDKTVDQVTSLEEMNQL